MECLLPRAAEPFVGDDEEVVVNIGSRGVCLVSLLLALLLLVVAGDEECDKECLLLKVKTLVEMTATGGGASAFDAFDDFDDDDDDDFCLFGLSVVVLLPSTAPLLLPLCFFSSLSGTEGGMVIMPVILARKGLPVC
jgi:hypothetical protein